MSVANEGSAKVAGAASYLQTSDIEDAVDTGADEVLAEMRDVSKKVPVVPSKYRPNVNRVTVPSLIVVSFVYFVLFVIIFLFYDAATTGSIADILVRGYETCKTAVQKNSDSADSNVSSEDVSYAAYIQFWREHRWRIVLRKMGLFVAVFGSLFGGLLGFVYVFLMKGSNVREAAKIIGICLATMLGTTFLLVDNQYFVTIFENTFGYQCMVSLKSTRDTIDALFQHRTFTQASFPGLTLWMNFLLSVFRMNNFGYVLQQIGDTTRPTNQFDFTLRSPDSDQNAEDQTPKHVQDLAKRVVRKHAMGHMCWIYFSAIAATMITVKQLSVIV